MLVSLKPDVFFRQYGDIGHIVRPSVPVETVVDFVGASFLQQLSYEPKNIDEISVELADIFSVNIDDIKKDATDFFFGLQADGYLNILDLDRNNVDVTKNVSNVMPININMRNQADVSVSFLANYFKDNPYLESFQIETTSYCNEKCIHCYNPQGIPCKHIDYKLMLDVLRQCREMGVLTVYFTGGEAMLHPNFCDFLRYAKDADLNTVILSNLTVLTDDIVDAIKYRHVSRVHVSIYSLNAEVHDGITTVAGSLYRTLDNVKKLLNQSIPVQINCPIMKQNKDTFGEVIEWAESHGCKIAIDYMIMARSDRTTDNLDNRIDENDLRSVISTLIKYDAGFEPAYSKETGEMIQIQENDSICGVAASTLCMSADGDIYPCVGWNKMFCGNIKKNSLKQIWEESSQLKSLRTIRLKDFKQCVNCEDNNYCQMCLSRNSNEGLDGNIFEIPPITCAAARITRELQELKKQ